jgi:hypothetical protein
MDTEKRKVDAWQHRSNANAEDLPDHGTFNVLIERPGMFPRWKTALATIFGWLLFSALIWAAIYELVRW